MTKKELALLVASHDVRSLISASGFSGMKSILFFSILFVGGLLVFNRYFLVNKIDKEQEDFFPKFRKLIAQYELSPGKVLSKQYSIYSVTKIPNPTPILFYEVNSDELKTKSNKKVQIFVAPEYEGKFLQEVKIKKINLEYSEGKEHTPRLLYPKLSIWLNLLTSIESNKELINKSKKNFRSEVYKHIDSKKVKDVSKSDLFEWGMFLVSLLIIPYQQKKRRNIFIENFRKEDVETAETCTIEKVHKGLNIFKRTGNVYPAHGQIYKVQNKQNIYVIYNGSKKESEIGILLNYENHYFFIPSKWIRPPQKKAT
jgi:hypothetical protein